MFVDYNVVLMWLFVGWRILHRDAFPLAILILIDRDVSGGRVASPGVIAWMGDIYLLQLSLVLPFTNDRHEGRIISGLGGSCLMCTYCLLTDC